MNAAVAMNELLRGLSPQIDSVNSSSSTAALMELSNTYNTQNNTLPFTFNRDSPLPFFMMQSALATATTSNILQQTCDNFNNQQKIANRPKVAHSVSAILGNSQLGNFFFHF